MDANAIIARARALVGTRFRLHGREPTTGLDCVGLVAAAYGIAHNVPTGYPLRGGNAMDYATMLDRCGSRRNGVPLPADTVLLAVGPQQFHLGIWTGESLIHAHAGQRRTVETPGVLSDELLGIWARAKD